MIVPVVTENVWLKALDSLPRWQPPAQQTLVIAPHPDDETLGAGGLIAFLRERGVDVAVAAVTDGENAYTDFPGLAETRCQEQDEALKQLGVEQNKIFRFGLTDSDVSSQKPELVEKLKPLVTAQTHIIAPWTGDFHPDHEACGWAATQVAKETGATITFYFFWTWHRGTPALLQDLKLVMFPLTEQLLEAKLQALSSHRSQLVRATNDPILPESLLDPAKRTFEVFLIP